MDSQTMITAPITAVVTAYQRIDLTLSTLQVLHNCKPRPNEIIVHVDANQEQCAAAIRQAYPDLQIILSQNCVGPGGGRNKLIAAAKNEFVASFDDDSYPIDADYFARVLKLFETFPAASILCAAVYHQGEAITQDAQISEWVSDFVGCACIYRRASFNATDGYVPLPVAYGMEEVDLALRLHAHGSVILRSMWLRVFHDTDLKRHANPEVTAGSIANLALLTYLRYPPSLWLIGMGQFCNRILWLIKRGRWRGILNGLRLIPTHLRRHQKYRKLLPAEAIHSYIDLRRNPVKAATF
jgi:GT2 family glycosyltransferase